VSRAAPVAALALLAAGWGATLWLAPFSDERVNDLFVYRSFAEPVWDGALPYRDVFLEYPPLAGAAIALPGFLEAADEAFRAAFAGWTLLLGGATVLLCGALATRSGGSRRRALLAAAAMPLLLGALVRTHFDLAPVVLLLGALLLLLDRRPRAGMALLGLGAMTKGFPLVAAPVTLAWLAAHYDRRTVRGAAGALLAALALPALLAVAVSPTGTLDALEYHIERPVQVESLPATGVVVLDALGAGDVERVQSHRSDGLRHPAAPALAALALLPTLAAIALAATRGVGGSRSLVLGALTAVLAFAALGRVLSPQYMLWLVPLGALAFAWRMHALAAALAAAAVLTQLEFPARYFDLVAGEPMAIVLVALRNLALLAALVLALRALVHPSSSSAGFGGASPSATPSRSPIPDRTFGRVY
jgi:Glycosyltransferase family 87